MNKSSCNGTNICNNERNNFVDLFIILVVFILLAIIVSAVFTYEKRGITSFFLLVSVIKCI